ncbi:thiol-activated cytolysin family protein [Weeksellaceae bacterium KMM 9713]|uniref:Thiol-activated cytolysin family protein n=1 Tax=Profundicola chukchiensis TaxID=2961959 RepID=A0A9X4N267_9FLAO|nr:thiol-activated cytolysin family protein [Profundicola chukchiensis]MDG4945249.1 thiol-activated cytolysin family protein [Profundicola chukchiensis]
MKTKLLFMGALLFLLMTSWSFAQRTPVGDGSLKKNKPTTGVNSSETIQANNPILIITSPTKNEQVKSPLIVKGNADRNTVIEVNVVVNYTGGSQDLGTFKVNTKSDGSWSTIPINLWMPEGARNVKFDITASIEQGDTTYTTNVVSVRPPQKTQTIPLSELKEARIKKLNPKAIQKSKRGGIQTGANGVKTPRRPKANNTNKGNKNLGIVRAVDTKNITQVKPKNRIDKKLIANKKVFDKIKWTDPKAGQNSFKTEGSGFEDKNLTTMKTVPGDKKKDMFCTNTILNTNFQTKSFKDFSVSGPPEWLKPGIIMDATKFVQGANIIEERYNRGPITVSFSGGGSKVIENPKNKSVINTGVKSLINSVPNFRPGASMTYNYSEVHSIEELNYKVNGRYSNSFYDVATKLGMESSTYKESHYYLVEFEQYVFNIEVDGLDKNSIFPNDNVDLDKYVYVSRVNYGRRGYFMFKTTKSLEEFGASASASMSYLGNKAAVEANINKIAQDESTQVTAFYYGGSSQSAATDISADWVENGRKPLEDYIKGIDFSPAEAYPISYELKNLNNERVGMTSENEQTIETCVPSKDLYLKVTLVELQNDMADGDDNEGDFGITQHVRYKANGQWKEELKDKTEFNKFPNHKSCVRGGENDKPEGFIALICGGMNRQLHMHERKTPMNRKWNVDNSVIFKISPDEANDKHAVFEIDTWVKEYSGTDIVLNNDPRKTKVAIHDVLATLQGIRPLSKLKAYSLDNAVNRKLKFDYFGGNFLPLRESEYSSKSNMKLEGPIRARNKGELKKKAFVWLQFELVDY